MSNNGIPQESISKIPQLVEREDGLFDFVGAESVQECVAIWRKIDSAADSARWAMAAVAANVVASSSYGDNAIEQFAESVGHKKRYIYRFANTHNFWTDRQKCPRGHYSDLTFSHHVKAVVHPDPIEAMEYARANGLPAIILEDWISEQAKASKPKKKEKRRKRSNEFYDFLKRVDGLIVDDFMATCPNAEWGRRVFRGWREDIAWELSQLERTEAKECVVDAIEDGAGTIQEIKSKTGLLVKEIEGVVGGLVAAGEFEWIREGGEPDLSRGTRRSILHRVGEACFA